MNLGLDTLTVSAIYGQTPAERNAAMRERRQPTHYGSPIGWAMEGYRLEMRHQTGRTPTHRGAPRNA